MRSATFLLLLLVVILAYAEATEKRRCPGEPSRQTCGGRVDVGSSHGANCRARAGQRWFYNMRSRQCEKFRYLGCEGNYNRHCTRAACEKQCIRRVDDDK